MRFEKIRNFGEKKGGIIQPPTYKGLVVAETRVSSILSLFAGAVDWAVLLLLGRNLGRWLDYRPGHRQSGINERRSCNCLLRIILVEGADQLF